MDQRPLIPVTETVRLLAETYTVPFSARMFHQFVLSAKVPAEKIKGRYFVRAENLPAIAAKLGLNPLPRNAI